MKFKFIALSIAIFSIVSAAIILSNNTAASSTGLSPEAQPTPKAVKTKTVRELTFIDGEFDGQELATSDADWKKVLTKDEFHVMREEGTERPYSGKLTENHKKGTYYCAACGLVLFKSDAKFDSGTGWPSFFQPIFKKNVTEKVDKSLSDERTEVECSRCHAHLGHVFDDGPKPTGLRYCMNSVSLRFKAAK